MGKKISVDKKWMSISQQAPIEEQWSQRTAIPGMKNTQIYGYNLLNNPRQRDYCVVCPHCLKSQIDSGLAEAVQCAFCLKMISNEDCILPIGHNNSYVPIANKRCSCEYFTSKLTSLLSRSTVSFVNPEYIKSIVLSINRDSVIDNAEIYRDSNCIDYEEVMKSKVIPFFSHRSRLIEKGEAFSVGDVELKVIGMIPEVKGRVSINTRIQCVTSHSNITPLSRALLITKDANDNLTTEQIKADILKSPREQLALIKGNGVSIGRHDFYIRNCVPECGVITAETAITIEHLTVSSISKIKLAVIKRQSLSFSPQFTQKDYERYVVEEYYKPYFISGVTKYIERGDVISIEDIELFVLDCVPESGYINSSTLFLLKFNKTKEQCLDYINQVDNNLALGMVMNNDDSQSTLTSMPRPTEIQLTRRRDTPHLRLRILGEYFITRELLQTANNLRLEDFQDLQLLSQEDMLRQQKLNKIVVSLPSFEVNEKYLGTIKSSVNDEINKRCVICMEEYALKQYVTTLPCFHIFHKKCINSWFESNYNCPICKCSLDKE